MQCPHHPKYMGSLPPKGKHNKDCEACWALYKEVSKTVRGYKSLTTPDFHCDLAHILAEVGTIMLFGQQPAFFWRLNVEAPANVKKYFGQQYRFIKRKITNEPEYFSNIKELLGIIYLAEAKKISAKQVRSGSVLDDAQPKDTIEVTQDIENVIERLPIPLSGGRKMSKWESWKRIGDTSSGQE